MKKEVHVDKIKYVEEKYLKKEVPRFSIGDTVIIYVKIKEEGKTRLQAFEGILIKRKGTGTKATFTVRRISYGEGVERTFLVHSPFIDRVEVKKKGAVRRSKLYYLKKQKGKKAKVEERIEHEAVQAGPQPGGDALPREKST